MLYSLSSPIVLLPPPIILFVMVLYHNPNNLGRRTYLRLLSHQRHIAYYLGCIFHTYTVVGFTVVPQEFCRMIASYLEESDKDAGFLINLGDTYQVVYNRRRGELFVCGFWVPCDYYEPLIDQIKSYIDLIPRNEALPPIPTGLYQPATLLLSPPNDE
jgi:hypothetical protein